MAIGSSAKSVILIYFDASLALVAPPHRRTPPGELGTHKTKPRELRQRAETVRTRVYVDHKQQRSISTIHAPRRRLPPITSLPHSDLPNCTRGAKSSLGISAALVDAFRPLNHYAQNVRSGRFGKSAYRSIVVLTIFHDFASFFMIFHYFHHHLWGRRDSRRL